MGSHAEGEEGLDTSTRRIRICESRRKHSQLIITRRGGITDCRLSLSTGALTKVKESQKHVEEGKMDPAQAEGINERCNIISCATLAEIQHFHQIRVRDFKAQMQHYLQQQISFFKRVTGKLEEALQKYDNV